MVGDAGDCLAGDSIGAAGAVGEWRGVSAAGYDYIYCGAGSGDFISLAGADIAAVSEVAEDKAGWA